MIICSDGHSSRFDYDVLEFLQKNLMCLFLSPSDTTSLLQLLHQINKSLYLEYKNEKDNLFTNFMTINREGFMLTRANIWNKWATKESIVNAAKRVGVTSTELSVDFMQQDKFDRAARYMESTEISNNSAGQISSPKQCRRGSAPYWKSKFEQCQALLEERREKTINLVEIPGFMTFDKVKPKVSKESSRVTQIHGSMQGCDVLAIVESLKNQKAEGERRKLEMV